MEADLSLRSKSLVMPILAWVAGKRLLSTSEI
jgi:hypothetical protein